MSGRSFRSRKALEDVSEQERDDTVHSKKTSTQPYFAHEASLNAEKDATPRTRLSLSDTSYTTPAQHRADCDSVRRYKTSTKETDKHSRVSKLHLTPRIDRKLRSATKAQQAFLMGPRPRNYLERLPLEIRRIIWRHLLIWPGDGMYIDNIHRTRRIEVSWNGVATRHEMKLLKEAFESANFARQHLPQVKLEDVHANYYDMIRGRTIFVQIDKDATVSKPPVLHKKYEYESTGLEALALLRTCRWVNAESTDLLYGENNFIFKEATTANRVPPKPAPLEIQIDKKPWTTFRKTQVDYAAVTSFSATSKQPSLPKHFSVPQLNELFNRTPYPDENPYFIPSLHSSVRTTPVATPNTALDQSSFPTRFCTNSLPQFFREVGPLNASKIRKLTITGDFWVNLLTSPGDYPLQHLLPTITPCLKSLTLRQQFCWSSKTSSDSDSSGDEEGEEDNRWKTHDWNARNGVITTKDWKSKKRQAKVDMVVGDMVAELEDLRVLRLEFASQFKEKEFPEKLSWGKTLRWIEDVEKRGRVDA